MKGFLKFVGVFAAILLLSAVLAPLFYDFFQMFHPYKFERIFNRQKATDREYVEIIYEPVDF